MLLGLPHAADVLSNIGFATVAIWGVVGLWPIHGHASLDAGRHGYRRFLVGLLLTAIGSALYHRAPDNASPVWDRIPIAPACAGLLAAVHAESLAKPSSLPRPYCWGYSRC